MDKTFNLHVHLLMDPAYLIQGHFLDGHYPAAANFFSILAPIRLVIVIWVLECSSRPGNSPA